MFGIRLTGQRAARGRRGEWRRDKLQTDKFLQRPFPPRAPLFMAPTEPHKSDARSLQPSAGIIALHGQVHPLSACLTGALTSPAAEAEMNV